MLIPNTNFLEIDTYLLQILEQKKQIGTFRQLTTTDNKNCIDFTSNDYLGFAQSVELKNNIVQKTLFGSYNGAGASRLLSGNFAYFEQVEKMVAQWHKAEAALIFASGYSANVGVFNTLARKNDVILYDELSHASTLDGIKLSKAKAIAFKHNDLNHLEYLLKNILVEQNCYISIETVYSMDGDLAPLAQITALARKYNALVIADEAHATGVFCAEQGRGLVCALGLEKEVFLRIHTFGKAMGVHGAAVVGTQIMKQYFINFCRSFIYTTAPSPHFFASIESAYEYLSTHKKSIETLHKNIDFFVQNLPKNLPNEVYFLKSNSPIQGVVVPDNKRVRKVAQILKNRGFDVRPIVSPTVAVGTERLRICLHTHNTTIQISNLLKTLEVILNTTH